MDSPGFRLANTVPRTLRRAVKPRTSPLQTAAAALRARDCVMDTVNKVQENAEAVLAEAKAVNEARAQQAQDAQEEEEVPAE